MSTLLFLLLVFFLGTVAFATTHTHGLTGPAFIQEPESTTVHLREDNAFFHCNASGTLPLTYTWLLNGQLLPSATSNIYEVFGVTLNDVGVYQCVAENKAGKIVSRKAELKFYGLSDVFKHDPVDTLFYVNQSTNTPGPGTAVFSCTAGVLEHSHTDTLTIEWERDFSNGASVPIRSLGVSRYVQFQVSLVSTLQIDQPELSDFEGGYRCVVTHPNVTGQRSTSKMGRLILTDEVEYAKFAFSMKPPTVYVKYNEPVILGCATRGEEQPVVHWKADGFVIGGNGGIVNLQRLLNAYELIQPANLKIKQATGGDFTCSIQSDLYNYEAEVKVVIEDPPRIVTSLQSLYMVTEGDRLELSCTANGAPNPTMTWLFNGVSFGNNNTNLLFSSISETDHGMHQCFTENIYGTDHSSTFVHVRYPAKVSAGPTDLVIHIGDTACFSCSARGNPDDIVYAWNKAGSRLANSSQVTMLSDGRLYIVNATLDDMATYTCIPSNSLGTGETASASLTVAIFPTITYSLDNVTVNASANAFLPCFANGFPNPTIQWTKVSNQQSQQDENGTLFLKAVTISDGGTYTCTATNVIGSTFVTTQLIVQVAPETPDNSTIYVKPEADVSISCFITSNPIPSVKWYHEGNQVTGLITTTVTLIKNEFVSILTITGFSDADIGDYQCRATNLLGTDSTTYHLLEQTVPDTPESVVVIVLSHSMINVQWTAPFDGGSSIDYFIIRYRESEQLWKDQHTSELSYTIRNLEPRRTYTIEVAALNNIGIGIAAVRTAVTHRLLTEAPKYTGQITSLEPTVRERQETSAGKATTGLVLGIVMAFLLLIVVIIIFLVIKLKKRQGQYTVDEQEAYPDAPFESPDKPQLPQLSASPRKVEVDPLASEADPEAQPELSKTASIPVEEPLIILKKEKDVTVDPEVQPESSETASIPVEEPLLMLKEEKDVTMPKDCDGGSLLFDQTPWPPAAAVDIEKSDQPKAS